MPQTISRSSEGQIIGGTFSSRENADKAIRAFEELGVPPGNIQVVVHVDENKKESSYGEMLAERGFSESQATYYDKAVWDGKMLVAVYGVVDPDPIVDIFDEYKAEYNPNGSRNLREDVLGMTAGAVIGAAAGGIAGAVLGGPIGAGVGVAAGAVVGGGSGAAAGKAAEHNK
jgi:hypothetical protein